MGQTADSGREGGVSEREPGSDRHGLCVCGVRHPRPTAVVLNSFRHKSSQQLVPQQRRSLSFLSLTSGRNTIYNDSQG